MITFPVSMTIQEAVQFYINGRDFVMSLSPEAVEVWPMESNNETLIKDKTGRTIYSAATKVLFTGPGGDDWKQVITHVYSHDKRLVYETDPQPYRDAARIAYENYLQDENAPGIKHYYPEDGNPRPAGRLTLTIGHYGGNYIDTDLTLKGRGITQTSEPDKNGRKSYRVTDKALDKLKALYSIVSALHYD